MRNEHDEPRLGAATPWGGKFVGGFTIITNPKSRRVLETCGLGPATRRTA